MTPSRSAEVSRPLRIGVAVYGDITFDSRVRREAETLAAAGHHVALACLPGAGPTAWRPPGVNVLPLVPGEAATLPGAAPFGRGQRRRGRFGSVQRVAWLAGYAAGLRAWGRQTVAAVGAVDAWHAHDLAALTAISPHVDRPTPIVYDSHELFLDTGGAARLPGPIRRLLRLHEARLVRRSAAVVTVNDELAAILARRYRPRRTVVVHNCPPRASPLRGPDLLRAAAGIPPDAPVVLHHGALGPNRGLETLVGALGEPGLERVHVVLMGFGGLRDAFRERALDPALGGRLHVLDAAPVDRLIDWISSADIGAIALPGTDLNLRSATPNKLFECLAAGVPVVVSDLPAVRRIVDGPDGLLGAIVDPRYPASVGAGIRSLLELDPAGRRALRARCRAAAERHWNWQTESARLVDLYAWLAHRDGHPAAPARPIHRRAQRARRSG